MNQGDYSAPFFLFHPHMETIYPAVFRPIWYNGYNRERIYTPDNDFLDLDWISGQNNSLVILCHGLEGNSRRPYMKGMSRHLQSLGFNVLSWNYRGCSGEINRQSRYYHSGATDDLDIIISHVLENYDYKKIFLVGFSLGGNLVLKYMGEEWDNCQYISSVVAISVPVDLEGCSVEIHKPNNWIYCNRFLATLRQKVKDKELKYPDLIDSSLLKEIKTLREFDDKYTAPLHGFSGATEYYRTCSSVRFLENVEVPALIINSRNDTFLSDSCYPEEIVSKKNNLHMLMPGRGGHVGFSSKTGLGTYWSEKVTGEFLVDLND